MTVSTVGKKDWKTATVYSADIRQRMPQQTE